MYDRATLNLRRVIWLRQRKEISENRGLHHEETMVHTEGAILSDKDNAPVWEPVYVVIYELFLCMARYYEQSGVDSK